MTCLEDAGERQQAVLLNYSTNVGAVDANLFIARFAVSLCAGPVGC
jgi:hypothetical protein